MMMGASMAQQGKVLSSRGHPVWHQTTVRLPSMSRGCHIVTPTLSKAIETQVKKMDIGMAHFHIMHTSASLTLNENCDPDVRYDMESSLNRIVGQGSKLFRHMDEGEDDMPAHVKSSLMGCGLMIPISRGKSVIWNTSFSL